MFVNEERCDEGYHIVVCDEEGDIELLMEMPWLCETVRTLRLADLHDVNLDVLASCPHLRNLMVNDCCGTFDLGWSRGCSELLLVILSDCQGDILLEGLSTAVFELTVEKCPGLPTVLSLLEPYPVLTSLRLEGISYLRNPEKV
jgi:hypothetical protein